MTQRMFPLIADHGRNLARPGPRSIPWSVAEKAYGVYVGRYGHVQSLERIAERGGFYLSEMDDMYPPWRVEVDQITALQAEIERLADALFGAISIIENDAMSSVHSEERQSIRRRWCRELIEESGKT